MSQAIREIHHGLDLGFSDCYSDQNVRDATIQNNLRAFEEAVGVLAVEEEINFALFQTRGEEHPSPQVYILDFPSDLRASFYLVLGGYYRPATALLRNWLEMRLVGVYFGLVISSTFEDWKRALLDKRRSPFGTKLIGWIFQRSEFHKAEKRVGLRTNLERLYEELSAFAHGAGLTKYNLQAKTDNVPRYTKASAILWLRLMYRTFGEVVFCLFLAYGKDALRGLDPSSIKTLLRHLPVTYRTEVRLALTELSNRQ